MSKTELYGGHYKRLTREGILKSAIWGGSLAFAINLIFALLYWLLSAPPLWLGAAVGIPLGAGLGVLLYFLRYKPDEKALMRRLDSFGLEERMITMHELLGDESEIAALQRRDALASLEALPRDAISIKPSRISVVLISVALGLSVVLTTLGALAGFGVIPFLGEALGFLDDGRYTVSYIADEGGRIFGESEQTLERGSLGTAVLALPDEGYIFVGWSDGHASPERRDGDLTEDLVLSARFERLDKSDGDTDEDGDEADDTPSAIKKDESGGGGSDPGGDTPGGSGGDASGGGKWQNKNQFIDGATYYRDYLDIYYKYATDIFDSSADLPDELVEFFEIYFGGI